MVHSMYKQLLWTDKHSVDAKSNAIKAAHSKMVASVARKSPPRTLVSLRQWT